MGERSMHQPGWLGWFLVFWRFMLWISLAVATYQALHDDPALLGSWRGAGMLGLIGVFLLAYELFERSDARRTGRWPVPYRQVLIYMSVQTSCALLLLHYSSGFVGVTFALMGQVFAAVERRHWLVPIGALVAVISVPIGIDEAIRDGDWGAVGGFVLFVAGWVGLALFIGMLFNERHEREHLIAELRRAKEDLERYATQAEELAALRERARLARDMHDSLGHALVVVNVQLEAAQRLYAVDRARGDASLAATRALVRDTMGELRRSLADLRAELPGLAHLPAALQSVADEVRARGGLRVNYTPPRELPPLPPATAEALWRVAREALANAERHAAAASATIALERHGGALVLRVADDGSGLSAGALARPGHYGVIGMRERVEALGGTFRIGERPGGGTLVEAQVPLV